MQACQEAELGKVDLEEEVEKRKGKFYIPNWFSVEIKTGVSVLAPPPTGVKDHFTLEFVSSRC